MQDGPEDLVIASAETEPSASVQELNEYDLDNAPCNLLKHALKRAGEYVVAEIGDEGLRPRQFTTLIAIYQNPGITQNDLVAVTGSDRSTTAELISRLDARGDIIRERDPNDQRANRLFVSDAGTEALRQSLRGTLIAEQKFREIIEPGLRSEVFAGLRKLADDGPIAE